jgi:hypothetical protein
MLSALLVAFFLPLFPFSLVFNLLLQRVRFPWLRGVFVLVWPQIGIALLQAGAMEIPDWFLPWALFSAAFYALRLLAVREVGIWTGFLATSSWALLWLPAAAGEPGLVLYGLAYSAPLLLLGALTAMLEARFGAAYAGLSGGLGEKLPRFSALLVIVVLAAVASPLFPGFFVQIRLLLLATPANALAVAGIWLLWSWAGIRLLQGFLVGPGKPEAIADLGVGVTWGMSVLLTALIAASLYMGGLA